MMKVLVAEKSWMSPVAQHLYMDGDGCIPGAVGRKTQLVFQKSQKGVALLLHLKILEFQEGQKWCSRRTEFLM